MNKQNFFILKYFQKRSFYYNMLRQNIDYMKAGTYYLTFTPFIGATGKLHGKIVWRQIRNNKIWLKHVFSNNAKIVIRLLLYKNKYSISANGEKGNGEELLITREKNVKIFDYSNQSIITRILDEKKYETIRCAKIRLGKYYSENHRYTFYDEDFSFSEKYIIYAKTWYENEKLVNEFWLWLTRKYSEYAKKIICNENIIKRIGVKELFEKYIEVDKESIIYKLLYKLKKKTESIENENVYYLYSHRDLLLENVIPEENGFIVIDYEDSGEDLFFFDLLFWQVARGVFSGDYRYIEMFMLGYYDSELEYIFRLWNISFSRYTHEQYLALVMTSMINRMLDVETNRISDVVLKNIDGIIQKMESIN